MQFTMESESDLQLMEIPTPAPRLAIFTRYVPVLDTTDSAASTRDAALSLNSHTIPQQLFY